MSEAEARAILGGRETEGLCVRYLYDERGDIVFRQATNFVPGTHLARMKRVAVAAMATLSLGGCSASMQTAPEAETRYTAMMGAPPPPPAATDTPASAAMADAGSSSQAK